jgi:hypothetical protein
MNAPRYMQRELQLIDSMYFAIYNPQEGRWQIRKWIGIYPKKHSLWKEFSENVLTIRKEIMTDEGLIDGGYDDLDMRVIYAIRKSHWFKLRWKQKITEMDLRNEMLERRYEEQFDYESKYAAKLIYRHLHEPTVLLSGKEWKV